VLAVLVFRSFYGSSEPGTPRHNDSIPSKPLRPLSIYQFTILYVTYKWDLQSCFNMGIRRDISDMLKKNRKILVATAGLLLGAGLLFAQGPGLRARGEFKPRFLGAGLGLTEDQKAKAKSIFGAAREQGKPVMEQLKSGHQAMAEAVKANDGARIKELADSQAALMSQLIAIRSQAMAQFYATLTPEQKAKADEFRNRVKERMEKRMSKRGQF